MYLPNNTLLQGGKYKIVRFISKGGFGLTYEGVHIMMNTRVAIKEFFNQKFCLRDEATLQVTVGTQGSRIQIEKLIKKFKEEAVAVFNMKHDNIVRVLDIFEENGTAYYVMEYIDGKSLDEITKDRGPLPEAEAVGYIRQIADALKYVHSLDRLHLDIKPGNIMIDKNGKAILIDFGASKHYDNETGENDSTLMGIYSEHYAPIEQFNRTFTTFSPSADIYALGATLYKLVTGIIPPTASIIASGETLEIPASLSTSIRNVIIKSMQTSRMMRPQSIAEFLQLLSAVSNNDDSTICEPSGHSAYTNHRTNVNDDESTRIETSTWQEEEARRKREFQAKAEREAKEREEARRHAEEVERMSREAERRRVEEERRRAAEEEAEKLRQRNKKKNSWKLWIGLSFPIAFVVWFIIATLNNVQSTNSSSMSQQGETQDSDYWLMEARDAISLENYPKAFGCALKSAEMGNASAMGMLGYLYNEGIGVDQNKASAVKWYTKSAELNDPYAQYDLGVMYLLGDGVTENDSKAFSLFQSSARQEYAPAQYAVGFCYERGEGIVQNLNLAKEWYEKSAAQGDENAKEALSRLKKNSSSSNSNPSQSKDDNKVNNAIQKESQNGTNITIKCNVSSKIWVDDKYMGVSPVSTTISRGAHKVRAVADGYNAYEGQLEVTNNSNDFYLTLEKYSINGASSSTTNSSQSKDDNKVNNAIQKESQNGTNITIKCNVSSKIWVDDKYMGVSPVSTTISRGVHKVRAVADGYNAYDGQLEVTNNSNYFYLTLEKYRTYGASSTIVVRGQVVDKHGDSIIGASIVEKGTNNGTVTDIDGNFTLKVSSNAQLEISFVGYKKKTVNAQSSIKVELRK